MNACVIVLGKLMEQNLLEDIVGNYSLHAFPPATLLAFLSSSHIASFGDSCCLSRFIPDPFRCNGPLLSLDTSTCVILSRPVFPSVSSHIVTVLVCLLDLVSFWACHSFLWLAWAVAPGWLMEECVNVLEQRRELWSHVVLSDESPVTIGKGRSEHAEHRSTAWFSE